MDDSVSIAYAGHHPPGFTLTRYTDGVILIVADDGVVLDAGSGRILRKEIAAISAGPYVVVADLRGVPFVDREARTLFADDESGRVLATAVIVGRVGPMKLLVERWLADNEVLRQVVTFPEPAAALAWGHAMAATMRAEGRLS